MMATTHVLAGVTMASAVAVVAPEFGPVALVAAGVGGALPDLDLYAGHRKTLHFPVYLPALALPAGVLALAVPTVVTVGVALLLLSAALHSAMDAWGGGLELKPWEGDSEKAVYSHYHGDWITPRRFVRYDGAPEDLLVAAALAVPTLVVFGDPVDGAVLAILGLSAAYTALRKPMVAAGEWVVDRLPPTVVGRIPRRFLGDLVVDEPQ